MALHCTFRVAEIKTIKRLKSRTEKLEGVLEEINLKLEDESRSCVKFELGPLGSYILVHRFLRSSSRGTLRDSDSIFMGFLYDLIQRESARAENPSQPLPPIIEKYLTSEKYLASEKALNLGREASENSLREIKNILPYKPRSSRFELMRASLTSAESLLPSNKIEITEGLPIELGKKHSLRKKNTLECNLERVNEENEINSELTKSAKIVKNADSCFETRNIMSMRSSIKKSNRKEYKSFRFESLEIINEDHIGIQEN